MDLLPIVSECLDLSTGTHVPVVRLLAWPIGIGRTVNDYDVFRFKTFGPAGAVTHEFVVRHGVLSETNPYCFAVIRIREHVTSSGATTWQKFDVIAVTNDGVHPGHFSMVEKHETFDD